jgi:hypothetical protein
MSLLSGIGMTVCMVGLAVYLQLVPNGSETALNNRQLSSIPLILLLVYVVSQHVTCLHTDAPCQTDRSAPLTPSLCVPYRWPGL